MLKRDREILPAWLCCTRFAVCRPRTTTVGEVARPNATLLPCFHVDLERLGAPPVDVVVGLLVFCSVAIGVLTMCPRSVRRVCDPRVTENAAVTAAAAVKAKAPTTHRRRGRRGKSVYRGVCVTREGKWRAVIYKERKQVCDDEML